MLHKYWNNLFSFFQIFFQIFLAIITILRTIKKIILFSYIFWYITIFPFLLKYKYIKFTFLNFSESHLELFILLFIFILMFIHEIKLTVQTDKYKNFFLSLGTNLFSLNLIKHFATTYPLDGDPFVIFITNNYFVFVF
jgi:hypothetical protein